MVKWTSDEIEWCSCNKLKEAEEKAAKWDAIVRCGECKHLYSRNIVTWQGEMVFDTHYFCGLMLYDFGERNNEVTLNDSCSWGERRDA